MTDTLWMRFAEDTGLPSVLTSEERNRLLKIFDVTDPEGLWVRAARALGLSIPPQTHHLRFHENSPYINWSVIVQMISSGCIETVREPDQSFSYKTSFMGPRFFSLLWKQLRLSLYLEQKLKDGSPLPAAQEEGVIESLALGLALLSLTTRLPAHTPAMLAQWLMDPTPLSPAVQKTLRDIQKIQIRRTALSSAWHGWFVPRPDPANLPDLPPHFWNDPVEAPANIAAKVLMATSWRGLPVSGGAVTGRAVFLSRDMTLPVTTDPLILVFLKARPETTELFGQASAVVYAEGGALSHACTIAREQGMPCVTGLGRPFFTMLSARDGAVWLSVDGAAGTVDILG